MGHGQRFSHIPKILLRALLFLVPAVLLVTFLALGHRSQKPELQPVLQSETEFSFDWQNHPLVEKPIPAGSRPVFSLSVVPGGVRDSQELQAAATADPVVARHYTDFQIARAHRVWLDRPMLMYVSYRRDNRVFWTRNRMTIPAGETLLTDGENFARTRCANRLSPVRALPVAAMDPTTEQLEQPSFVPPLLAGLLPGETGYSAGPPVTPPGPAGPQGPPSGGSVTPPILPPILFPGGPPISPNTPVIPPPPPVDTPEPGSLSLLLSGVAALLLLSGLFRRR